MSLTEFIVGALATWRLSHLFLYENGPFAVLHTIREYLGVTYDEFGRIVSYRYEVVTCIWCLSMWVGFIVAGMLRFWRASFWCLLPFALSAVGSLLGRREAQS